MTPLLAVHAAATWVMVGVIWFVQLVHYPMLDRAAGAGFAAYQRENTRRTAWVVIPPMAAEALTALALVLRPPAGVPRAAAWAGLALVAAIWLSTALLQVPRHRRLESGYDAVAHRGLVATNWIRTAAWSARGGLVLWMILRAE
ncbi:MAG: hypothetical protein MUE47_05535 [Acidobacteria bacterium]|nr:hypothetical protein [Acidobacteriota bacterium]